MDRQNEERKPLIGITCHADAGGEEDLYPGTPLNYMERIYAGILAGCGMIPILIPVYQDNNYIRSILLRTGSADSRHVQGRADDQRGSGRQYGLSYPFRNQQLSGAQPI